MINAKRGFTLIELLVVISIIGILATLLLANVAGVRERARDAQRKSDINQIQKALEMYKNSQATPKYPGSAEGNLNALIPNYLKSSPHDPKCRWIASSSTWDCSGWVDYSYAIDATDNLKYTLKACLENLSDPQSDASRGLTDTCDPGTSYTTSEL